MLDAKAPLALVQRMFVRALVPFRFTIVGAIVLSLASCAKKRGEAIVVEKEHIDAAEIKPSPTPGSSPAISSSPANEESAVREMAPDEIDVDSYVMKKEVRGTSKDPRAGTDEKWLVKVRLVEGGRGFNIHTDRAHYEKVKVGDRIKVRYSEGKYTGTVWGSEIED
jgi:hypothetical protein